MENVSHKLIRYKKLVEITLILIVLFDRLLNHRFTIVSALVLCYFTADYLYYRINSYLDKKAADKILPKISFKAIKKAEESNVTSFDERVRTRSGLERYLYLRRYARILDSIKKIRENSEEKTIKLLDIGSGYGNLDLDVAKINSIKVIGTDISCGKTMVALGEAKAQDLDCEFVVCDAEKLPFLKDSFDIVVCSEVIEHVLRPRKLIDEIRYVLKSEGFIILTTPNAHAISYDTSPLVIAEKIISPYMESVLAPRHNIHAFDRREGDPKEHLIHRSFSRRELKNLFKGWSSEFRTFHYGVHVYYLFKNEKILEFFEHVFPKVPILKYLGCHWWVKARKSKEKNA